MNDTASSFYNRKIEQYDEALKGLKRTTLILYLVRIISFIAIVALGALCVKQFNGWLLLLLLGSLAVFVLAVRRDKQIAYKIQELSNKRIICVNELNYIRHDFAFADTGEGYSILDSILSADFDLVGNGSLFQYINRSTTKIGCQRFAESIQSFSLDKTTVLNRQQAIRELSESIDFIIDFRAQGSFFEEEGNEVEKINKWLAQPSVDVRIINSICILLPLFNTIWVVLVFAGFFSVNSLLVMFFIAFFVVTLGGRYVNYAHESLSKIAGVFSKYAKLIELIECSKFSSEYLQGIKQSFGSIGVGASQALQKLFGLLKKFDLRYNLLASFILNSTFAFDFQVYRELLSWRKKHGEHTTQWIDALSKFDSMLGFATFAYNNSQNLVFPDVYDDEFVLIANGLGHPLIDQKDRVTNSINLQGNPLIIVVTGANMAGKSTFLRTVAVNLILAMNGAPVCAQNFKFTPCNILSSIKISDSLANNESYFYSELLRLKEILEFIDQNPRSLVILDEILRGTNTKDKQIGSLGLLEKLIAKRAIAIIATHDLSIGELANKYPGIVQNKCFEVELIDNQLLFDYKLKEGISQKLNASFLMEQMGIIGK